MRIFVIICSVFIGQNYFERRVKSFLAYILVNHLLSLIKLFQLYVNVFAHTLGTHWASFCILHTIYFNIFLKYFFEKWWKSILNCFQRKKKIKKTEWNDNPWVWMFKFHFCSILSMSPIPINTRKIVFFFSRGYMKKTIEGEEKNYLAWFLKLLNSVM